MTELKLVTEGRGHLPYMLFWQSLDGRPSFKDYETLADALAHAEHLSDLGRQPALFVRVDLEADGD
jgi:hypothetical protein